MKEVVPFARKCAVALLSVSIFMRHVGAIPVQAPLQPVKVEFISGVGVRVMTVPELYASEQSEPQLIPAGLLVTVPVPVPDLVTARVC